MKARTVAGRGEVSLPCDLGSEFPAIHPRGREKKGEHEKWGEK